MYDIVFINYINEVTINVYFLITFVKDYITYITKTLRMQRK